MQINFPTLFIEINDFKLIFLLAIIILRVNFKLFLKNVLPSDEFFNGDLIDQDMVLT